LSPFPDPDVVSLDHLGLTEPLTGLAALGTTSATASGLTGAVTAMPADGYADAAALDTVAAAGIRRIVLSADSLPDLAAGHPAVSIPTNEGHSRRRRHRSRPAADGQRPGRRRRADTRSPAFPRRDLSARPRHPQGLDLSCRRGAAARPRRGGDDE